MVGEGLQERLFHFLASGDFPDTRPISSHFTHCPYVTGALPAVALVLNSRARGFLYTHVLWNFKTMRALEVKFPENVAVLLLL